MEVKKLKQRLKTAEIEISDLEAELNGLKIKVGELKDSFAFQSDYRVLDTLYQQHHIRLGKIEIEHRGMLQAIRKHFGFPS